MEKLSVKQKLVLTVLSFLLLLAAAVPWRIWLNMHPALRILEGEQYSVNIASPLTIHVRGDRDGILSLNGVPVSSSASKVNLRHPLLLSGLELGWDSTWRQAWSWQQ